MTTKPPRAAAGGFCNPSELPKGPNGRALCRRCSTEVPKGRQSFCGEACIREWKIRTQPGYAARLVEERDQGVCALCARDCLAALDELKALAEREMKASPLYRKESGVMAGRWAVLHPDRFPEFHARCDELKLARNQRDLSRRLWEMDHTIPVVEGGGSCGLENLRTLCWECHRKETAALAARRAQARRARG